MRGSGAATGCPVAAPRSGDASVEGVRNRPHTMTIPRNLALGLLTLVLPAMGLLRINGVKKTKEATGYVAGDRDRALPLRAA
ncbi:hypothetical protein Francci3_1588 [Frankia casuarinae]|uniref:Uncharacterized protein n=1 Tax=Frankia casuarinae (strain DSM 45818 / CECT 9043 / HFP020203 / CcI3) TaxID=106370 RepID=Q2JCM8_FRACC|nr:hypothetical protein Francci3_1588 [Frankia casuarinae]